MEFSSDGQGTAPTGWFYSSGLMSPLDRTACRLLEVKSAPRPTLAVFPHSFVFAFWKKGLDELRMKAQPRKLRISQPAK
jgi:hypothetical protein